MAEPSFACRSAQVPVKLKMHCCTVAHCMPRTIYAWLTPAEACLCRLPMDAQQGHWWRLQPNPSASIPSHPMQLSAVHIDRATRSEHMAAF